MIPWFLKLAHICTIISKNELNRTKNKKMRAKKPTRAEIRTSPLLSKKFQPYLSDSKENFFDNFRVTINLVKFPIKLLAIAKLSPFFLTEPN